MGLERGTLLNGKYEVIKFVKKGSTGNIYVVQNIENKEKFFVSELDFISNFGSTEKAARDIIFRQSDFMVKCNHKGLPRTYGGVFRDNKKDYLLMEYIEGSSLEDIIKKSDKPPEEKIILKWTLKLADILEYLHKSFHTTIILRNLQPSNIIITGEDEIKLTDFGLVRYFDPLKDTDTFRHELPGYSSPEQYKGGGQSTPKSDVYSLGVIIFQLITGYDPTEKPFKFPEIKSLKPSLSDELEKIIKKSIELDPEKDMKI